MKQVTLCEYQLFNDISVLIKIILPRQDGTFLNAIKKKVNNFMLLWDEE